MEAAVQIAVTGAPSSARHIVCEARDLVRIGVPRGGLLRCEFEIVFPIGRVGPGPWNAELKGIYGYRARSLDLRGQFQFRLELVRATQA